MSKLFLVLKHDSYCFSIGRSLRWIPIGRSFFMMFWLVDGVWRAFIELLIGQISGWSRYNRLRGKGAAPAPILNPASGWSCYDRLHRTEAAPESILNTASCILCTSYSNNWLYRIHPCIMYHHHQTYLIFLHTSNNLGRENR